MRYSRGQADPLASACGFDASGTDILAKTDADSRHGPDWLAKVEADLAGAGPLVRVLMDPKFQRKPGRWAAAVIPSCESAVFHALTT